MHKCSPVRLIGPTSGLFLGGDTTNIINRTSCDTPTTLPYCPTKIIDREFLASKIWFNRTILHDHSCSDHFVHVPDNIRMDGERTNYVLPVLKALRRNLCCKFIEYEIKCIGPGGNFEPGCAMRLLQYKHTSQFEQIANGKEQRSIRGNHSVQRWIRLSVAQDSGGGEQRLK